jgi:hypothetical protein
VLVWFVPMVEVSGGLSKYLLALSSLWHVAGGRHTLFNSSPGTSAARILAIALICAVCFGPAVFLPARAFIQKRSSDTRQKPFTWIWITPGLLFFAFIFLLFVNSGYLLVIFPPVFAWLGLWASEWYAGLRFPKPLRLAVVGLLAAINILVFFEAPMYCSYRSVREFEASMRGIQRSVQGIASPEHTLIIGFDSHFLGYRHAGYYLPQYETIEYPKMPVAGGTRIAMMRNRDTHLLQKIDTAQFKNFLLFPLPLDEKAYVDYTVEIKAKFPQADLRTVHAGDHDFIMGPISDLRFLYPDAVKAPPVYTACHANNPGVYSR